MKIVNRIVVVAGGTGGHIFPGLAILEEARKRNLEVLLITDQRGEIFLQKINWLGPRQVLQIFRPTLFSLYKIFSFAKAFRETLKLLKVGDFVIGTGSYAVVPSILAASYKKIPIGIFEQNSSIGLANKILGPLACKHFGGFPGLPTPYFYTGNPIRFDPNKVSKSKRRKKLILIIGGSQGSTVFDKVVPAAIEKLPFDIRENIYVAQQSQNPLTWEYSKIGVEAKIQPFFSDIAELLKNAAVVICRAGASTIAELIAFQAPAILIPYPHAGNHQLINAKFLVDSGAALLLEQKDLTAKTLAVRIQSLINNSDGIKKSLKKLVIENPAARILDQI